jgi:hypothetical protein
MSSIGNLFVPNNYTLFAAEFVGAVIGEVILSGVVSGPSTATTIIDGNITNNMLATLTAANLVANSATTAVATATPNTIVLRDLSGNFSANIITANVNGNINNSGSNTMGALTVNGGAGSITQLSGNATISTGISLGRTTDDFDVGVAGAVGQFFGTGFMPVSGTAILRAASGGAIILGSGGTGIVQINSTGLSTTTNFTNPLTGGYQYTHGLFPVTSGGTPLTQNSFAGVLNFSSLPSVVGGATLLLVVNNNAAGPGITGQIISAKITQQSVGVAFFGLVSSICTTPGVINFTIQNISTVTASSGSLTIKYKIITL